MTYFSLWFRQKRDTTIQSLNSLMPRAQKSQGQRSLDFGINSFGINYCKCWSRQMLINQMPKRNTKNIVAYWNLFVIKTTVDFFPFLTHNDTILNGTQRLCVRKSSCITKDSPTQNPKAGKMEEWVAQLPKSRDTGSDATSGVAVMRGSDVRGGENLRILEATEAWITVENTWGHDWSILLYSESKARIETIWKKVARGNRLLKRN